MQSLLKVFGDRGGKKQQRNKQVLNACVGLGLDAHLAAVLAAGAASPCSLRPPGCPSPGGSPQGCVPVGALFVEHFKTQP